MTITQLSEKINVLGCKKSNATLYLQYDYRYVKAIYIYTGELEKSKNSEHR